AQAITFVIPASSKLPRTLPRQRVATTLFESNRGPQPADSNSAPERFYGDNAVEHPGWQALISDWYCAHPRWIRPLPCPAATPFVQAGNKISRGELRRHDVQTVAAKSTRA
ncbi:MAG: hypothetical protein ABIW96_08345, partial [Polaromonas sp.]